MAAGEHRVRLATDANLVHKIALGFEIDSTGDKLTVHLVRLAQEPISYVPEVFIHMINDLWVMYDRFKAPPPYSRRGAIRCAPGCMTNRTFSACRCRTPLGSTLMARRGRGIS